MLAFQRGTNGASDRVEGHLLSGGYPPAKVRYAPADMADSLSTEVRSRLMGRVRGKNTAPELAVRRALHAAGFRYRIHRKDLSGRPDIVLPRYRIVVFVHGCFWHGHSCRRGKLPQTNETFWANKIARNRQRDEEATDTLKRDGWDVVTIWQCDLDAAISELISGLDRLRATARFAAT
jgi:DNA mismatch endonuclease (patch repair protein)